MKKVIIGGEKMWVQENRKCRSCGQEGPETNFQGDTCVPCFEGELADMEGGFDL